MGKAARLVAQIHDELLLEVNTHLCDVYVVAGELGHTNAHTSICIIA